MSTSGHDFALSVQPLEEVQLVIGERQHHGQQLVAVRRQRLRPLRQVAAAWRVTSPKQRNQHRVGLGGVDSDIVDRYRSPVFAAGASVNDKREPQLRGVEAPTAQ